MKGFLRRWIDEAAHANKEEKVPGGELPASANMYTASVAPEADYQGTDAWQTLGAVESELFQEQGVTGTAGRIPARTGTVSEPKNNRAQDTSKNLEFNTPKVHKGDDPDLAEACNKIASLLAMAYRRPATIKRAGEHQATSGNRELANSARSSVHGVVQ